MPTFALRAGATLLLALAAALLFARLRVPLPWMLGPLLSVAVASVLHAPTRSWQPLRDAGSWVLGVAIGLYFTPQMAGLVGRLWWAVLASVAWALAMGWVFGLWLQRTQGARMGVGPREQRATCFFAGAIGGSSEMTALAERQNGRSDLVVAAHTVRVLLTVLALPFAFTLLGLHGSDSTLPGPREVRPLGLLLLFAAAAGGTALMYKMRLSNPAFLGGLLVSSALSIGGVELSAVPGWLSNAAQLVLGVGLGVRFQREFLRAAPAWLGAVAVGTIASLLLCAGFGMLLAWLANLPGGTMVLGTAPGGVAEMAITAKVMQLGVPVVTAFQVTRVVAVLVLVEPLYHWWAGRQDRQST